MSTIDERAAEAKRVRLARDAARAQAARDAANAKAAKLERERIAADESARDTTAISDALSAAGTSLTLAELAFETGLDPERVAKIARGGDNGFKLTRYRSPNVFSVEGVTPPGDGSTVVPLPTPAEDDAEVSFGVDF